MIHDGSRRIEQFTKQLIVTWEQIIRRKHKAQELIAQSSLSREKKEE